MERARPRPGRPRARRRPALQHGDHPRRGLFRQERPGAAADLGHLRGMLRQRRQGRHQAQDLRHLPGDGPGAAHPGLLHDGAHLRRLPGPRPHHRDPLPVLRRRRPRHPRAHAVGEHPRGRRGRHPHPTGRRGRGRHARRPARRSLHFSVAGAARVLPARRRGPALPGAGLDGYGRARRRIRGSLHRRRQEPREGARRHPVRPPVPASGQGHAGAALAPGRRHVCAGRGRDAAEPDPPPARAFGGVREAVVPGHPAGILGLFRRVKEFFGT